MWLTMCALITIASLKDVFGEDPECGTNEEFRTCGRCETTCDDIRRHMRAPCTPECRPAGCQCKRGYVRSDNGTCETSRACKTSLQDVFGEDPECGTTEEFRKCGRCETTCDDIRRHMREPCTPECRPAGCQCKSGFVRSDNNSCETARACKRCKPNEEFKKCGPCDTTCKQILRNETAVCTSDCREPGCGCTEGFYRYTRRHCVMKSRCETDPCAGVTCDSCEDCIPDEKDCTTTECPQFKCVPREVADPCLSNPCGEGGVCKRYSCDQFECIK